MGFPPYAYIPGHWPHPVADPNGHSYDPDAGAEDADVEPFEPERWAACPAYLHAVELFNAGYYWEAHELWEALWNEEGRYGPVADFLKGLIKLGAAAVKIRQGTPRAVASLATAAAEHFREVARERGSPTLGGLSLPELAERADELAAAADELRGDPKLTVEVVVPWTLSPGDGSLSTS